MGKLATVISCLTLVTALLVGLPGQSLAVTTGQGTLIWDFGSAPTYQQYNYSQGYFGNVSYFAGGPRIYPSGGNWGPQGSAYLPYAPYQDGGNVVNGSWNPNTSAESFNITALSPDPATTTALSEVDLFAACQFANSPTSPAISAIYDFYGTSDSALNFLRIGMQVEIGYYNGETDYKAYSDYQGVVNSPWFVQEGTGVMDESGIVAYGPYILPDGVYSEDWNAHWYMRWDFGGYALDVAGGDDNGGENPVPEPATMLLVGAGLVGLAGLKRRKG